MKVIQKNTDLSLTNGSMNMKTACLFVQSKTHGLKNLHWKNPRSPQGLEILLQTGQTVSVWTAFGFPNVVKYDDWEDTWFLS